MNIVDAKMIISHMQKRDKMQLEFGEIEDKVFETRKEIFNEIQDELSNYEGD